MERFIDMATKLATILIIPLVIWGVKLEVDLAVAKTERAAIQSEVHRLEDQNQAVLSSVRENTLALRELSTTMTYVKDRVDEIRADMRATP